MLIFIKNLFQIKKMKNQLKTLATLIAVLVIVSSCTPINAYFGSKKNTINSKDTDLYIPSSISSIPDLFTILLDAKVIDQSHLKSLEAIIGYKEFESEMIGPGKYIIKPKTNFNDLINGFTKNRLGNGNQEVEVDVTFNNCKNIYDVAGKVSKQIEMDSSDFVNYILSDSILSKYGFTRNRVVSLFLPNTYRMFWDTDEVEFVNTMAKEFKDFWTAERLEKIKKIGLKGQSDVVTLASVVYQEQNRKPEEWKTIAGLYLNRLRIGMKLQSDPTFRYCWGDKLDGVERLTFEHRDIDCPYNTYKYAGLPPGPIYIPPAQVVDAVLNAENNDYLYMCAQPNYSGLHNFAKSYSQHQAYASQYHRWLTSINK